MEVFLVAIFFITILVFFIVGKDDFGRKENKTISQEMEKVKKEEGMEPIEGGKKEEGMEPIEGGKKEEEL